MDETNNSLQRELELRLPEVRLNSVAFSDAIEFLRDMTGTNIFVNWRLLEVAGVDRNALVSIRLRDVKFSKVLDTILHDVGGGIVRLAYIAHENVITISLIYDVYWATEPRETSSALSFHRIRQWLVGEQANVAIVFTDIVGSTSAESRIGGEAYREIRRAHFRRSRKLIENHAGIEVKTVGDRFIALFRTSIHALDFSLDLQQDSGDPGIRVRTGIHMGMVTEEENDVFGSDVNIASRVVDAAKLSQILLSEDAKRNIEVEKPQRFAWLNWNRQEYETKEGKMTLWEVSGSGCNR